MTHCPFPSPLKRPALAMLLALLLLPNPGGASAAEEKPQQTDARAQAVIDNHFATIGGFRRYLSIRSMLTVARVRQGAHETIITTAREAPFNYRVETSPAHDPDSEVRVEGSNGDKLWYIDTAKPDAGITVEPWRYVQAYDFYGPLVDHQRKDIIFAYRGKDSFRGREAEVLQAWYPDGTTEELFFSAANGIMLGSRSRDASNPDSPEFTFLIAQYQQFEGVLMPTEIHTLVGERVLQTLAFQSIVVNYDFDSSIFNPPDLDLP